MIPYENDIDLKDMPDNTEHIYKVQVDLSSRSTTRVYESGWSTSRSYANTNHLHLPAIFEMVVENSVQFVRTVTNLRIPGI